MVCVEILLILEVVLVDGFLLLFLLIEVLLLAKILVVLAETKDLLVDGVYVFFLDADGGDVIELLDDLLL